MLRELCLGSGALPDSGHMQESGTGMRCQPVGMACLKAG